jgi:hypothetical protein
LPEYFGGARCIEEKRRIIHRRQEQLELVLAFGSQFFKH